MAARRPIYRKQESRSISKTGLVLCVLLAGGVLLVPTGGDVVRTVKLKVRDLVMTSTLVDLDACVVTADHALACTSNAVGLPLAVALRQMKDSEAQAAQEKKQRLKAEGVARRLAMELERLGGQSRLADRTDRPFPPLVPEMTPAARTGGAAESGSPSAMSILKAATKPQLAEPPADGDAVPFSPPEESD